MAMLPTHTDYLLLEPKGRYQYTKIAGLSRLIVLPCQKLLRAMRQIALGLVFWVDDELDIVFGNLCLDTTFEILIEGEHEIDEKRLPSCVHSPMHT